MITGYSNGHKITYSNNEWVYANGEKCSEQNIKPCVKCDGISNNGHDACIANLPGVKNACCGHGVHEGYIQFENGTVVRGLFTIEKK